MTNQEIKMNIIKYNKHESLIGQKINRYRISEFIGTGLTARVYKCEKNKKPYAIKIFKYFEIIDGDYGYNEYMDYFEIEISNLTYIKNIIEDNNIKKREYKNILIHNDITCLFIDLTSQNIFKREYIKHLISPIPCIIYPLCNGTLEDIIKDKNNNRLDTIKQIAKGLKFLHKHNIIHTDLKPTNILINNDVAIICDLGASIITSKHKKHYRNIGCNRYQSPESLISCGFTKATDIWSFGCIIYEIMTTKSIFTNQYDTNEDNYSYTDEYIYENSLFDEESIDEDILDRIEKLKIIFELCGKIPVREQYKYSKLIHKKYLNILNQPYEYTIPKIKNKTINEILKEIFVYDYKKRITIDEIIVRLRLDAAMQHQNVRASFA